jgi:phosphate transport system substrate-binding protein
LEREKINMIINRHCAAVVLMVLASLSAMNSYAKETIQIKGSDTMVNLGQAWAEEFNKLHPDINVAVTGGGSGTGISSLLNGTCDIAETSRVMEDKEIAQAQAKGINPIQEIVALDGIAVVVNPNNPVKNLTIDQLREIFMGNITNWEDVGGVNKEIVMLSREVNSGTHIFFKEHVLRKGKAKGPEEFSPAALLMSSSQAIADEISNNENAIGYYGMGYITPKQKVITVAKDSSGAYIEPTAENIKANTYPISRPLYMCTNGQPQGTVKEFIDFVYSKEGQEIVRKLDFVSIK